MSWSRASRDVALDDYFRRHPGLQSRRRAAVRHPVVRRHAAAVLPRATCCSRPASTRRRRPGSEWTRDARRDQGAWSGRIAIRSCCRSTNSSRCSMLALQQPVGAAARRRALRQFPQRRLPARAGRSTRACSQREWAPRMTNTQISNVWDEFGRGYFSFYISGPWNIAEFKQAPAARLAGCVDDGADAGPERSGRVERRRCEPGDLQSLAAQGRRRGQLVGVPVAPVECSSASTSSPATCRRGARRGRRRRSPSRRMRVRFATQLDRVRSPPQGAGVGAHRARRCASRRSASCRASQTVDEAVVALDRKADEILEKRRWMLDQAAAERT